MSICPHCGTSNEFEAKSCKKCGVSLHAEAYNYFAFISYSHKDIKWAKWLKHKLDFYRLPTTISKQHNLPQKIKTFRDKDVLAAGALNNLLRDNLDHSKYLIVICSPNSSKSTYVGEEISYFYENKQDITLIIPFIVDGNLNAHDSKQCFNDALLAIISTINNNILAIDYRTEETKYVWAKKERAFVRLICAMHGLTFDTLWNPRKRFLLKKYFSFMFIALFICILCGLYLRERPFNMNISFDESSFSNKNLPFVDGEIICINGQDTICSKQIGSINEHIVIKNIVGKLKDKDSRFIFDAFGYESMDTVTPLADNIIIRVRRKEDTYGLVQGIVCDSTVTPEKIISGATVMISCHKAVTDSGGHFILRIPLEQQLAEYQGVVIYNHHRSQFQTIYPCRDDTTSASLSNYLYIK